MPPAHAKIGNLLQTVHKKEVMAEIQHPATRISLLFNTGMEYPLTISSKDLGWFIS